MNSHLISLYKSLSEPQKKEIQKRLSRSPFKLSLLKLAEKVKSNKFTDAEAVFHLYNIQSTDSAYEQKKKTFYVLRGRLIEDLKDMEGNELKHSNQLSKLIYDLEYTSIFDSNWLAFQKKLDETEELLWKNNLFELLNKFYEIRIRKNFLLGNIRNYRYVKKRKQINLLINDLHDIQNYFFEISELHSKFGKESINDFLERIKYITSKNKAFSRFRLLYHYLTLRLKLDLTSIVERQTVSKHLNSLRKINIHNPDIPLLFYNNNYQVEKKIYLLSLETFIARNNQDFELQEKLLEQIIEHKKQPGIVGYSTMNIIDYSNLIDAKMFLKKFHEAFEICEELKKAMSKDTSHLNYYPYLKMGEVMCYSFPMYPIANFDFIINRLNEYIDDTGYKKSKRVNIDLIQYLLSRLELMRGNFYKASELIKKEEVKNIIQKYLDYETILSYFNAIITRNFTDNKNQLEKINKLIFKEENLIIRHHYEWLEKIYKYYQQKN